MAGKASEPVLSAYPANGSEAEDAIRLSSEEAEVAALETGAYRTTNGRATSTVTTTAHTHHRQAFTTSRYVASLKRA